ncbi:MAG: hypothetical protein U5K84_06880 [Alkalibacterium sp.]|nr:hypothetical protein [Alkalibacterium sp.]
MKKIKITYSLIGTVFIALAVTTFRLASLGTDPYTTFNLGFSMLFNMEFGIFLMYSSLLMLIYVFFANRALIGIGTIFNIFIVGNLSDVFVNQIPVWSVRSTGWSSESSCLFWGSCSCLWGLLYISRPKKGLRLMMPCRSSWLRRPVYLTGSPVSSSMSPLPSSASF